MYWWPAKQNKAQFGESKALPKVPQINNDIWDRSFIFRDCKIKHVIRSGQKDNLGRLMLSSIIVNKRCRRLIRLRRNRGRPNQILQQNPLHLRFRIVVIRQGFDDNVALLLASDDSAAGRDGRRRGEARSFGVDDHRWGCWSCFCLMAKQMSSQLTLLRKQSHILNCVNIKKNTFIFSYNEPP